MRRVCPECGGTPPDEHEQTCSESGECDCGATYAVASRTDHCAECGTCWEHCRELVIHKHENHDEQRHPLCHDCDLELEADAAQYAWMARVPRESREEREARQADRELMLDEYHGRNE